MPVHDWTRVDAGVFHSFHNAWIADLTKSLNRGLLPKGYHALSDQVAGLGNPDMLTLESAAGWRPGDAESAGLLTAVEALLKVRTTVQMERRIYSRRQKQVVVRHRSGNRIAAILEIVSSGNKDSRHSISALVDKVLIALDRGIHLLIVDLYPPGPRDPDSIHGVISKDLGEAYQHPADKPLTLAAYTAGLTSTAYVQPVAVGDSLPEMPLFLTEDRYVNVPLEATYLSAYDSVADDYRTILEAGNDT